MSNPTPKQDRRVRFEEVTPTNTIVAFFDVRLSSLVNRLDLPIYEAYDDLDEMQLAFLTLPSGQTVTLAQYENAPQIGVDLYVDIKTQDVPAVVFESCQYLEIPRSNIPWFHPDFQEQIDGLYLENRVADRRIQLVEVPELSLDQSAPLEQHLPTKIDCFKHALRIYPRLKFPLYWAMLQHNLGLAYFDRVEGNRLHNLKRSIECFERSLEIYTQQDFPGKWKINQDNLKESQKSLLIDIDVDLRFADLSYTNLSYTNLSYADLIGTNLSYANLSYANLSHAYLSRADLSYTNLSYTKLSYANLSYADLSHANVRHARFEFTHGIPESLKQDLISRGAIFNEAPGDRSESRTLVPC
jgi:Pentapeptide repeats (8 copies)